MYESSVSIVIPTYRREQVLLDSINQLIQLDVLPLEIIIVDQTLNHTEEVQSKLRELNKTKIVKWVKLVEPSIPSAMNYGAMDAKGEIILFLDDDIELTSELVLEHEKEYLDDNVAGIAGGVIQSWEKPLAENDPSYRNNDSSDPDGFMFNSAKRCEVMRFIGCNVSFRKRAFISAGGFDENFVRVAYRYEAEFADRFLKLGNVMVFAPLASIKHLKTQEGGTRSFGDHLKTISPAHAVGRYYYFLTVESQKNRAQRILLSPIKSVLTRFHLKNPWWIPVTIVAELLGIIWALKLRLSGAKLIRTSQ